MSADSKLYEDEFRPYAYDPPRMGAYERRMREQIAARDPLPWTSWEPRLDVRRAWPYGFENVLEYLRQGSVWVDRYGAHHPIEHMTLDYVANAIAWLQDNAKFVANRALKDYPVEWPLVAFRVKDHLELVASSPLYRALAGRLAAALDGRGAMG